MNPAYSNNMNTTSGLAPMSGITSTTTQYSTLPATTYSTGMPMSATGMPLSGTTQYSALPASTYTTSTGMPLTSGVPLSTGMPMTSGMPMTATGMPMSSQYSTMPMSATGMPLSGMPVGTGVTGYPAGGPSPIPPLTQGPIEELEWKKRELDMNKNLKMKEAEIESDKQKKLETKAEKHQAKAAKWRTKNSDVFGRGASHEKSMAKFERKAHDHYMKSEQYKMEAKMIEDQRRLYDPPKEKKEGAAGAKKGGSASSSSAGAKKTTTEQKPDGEKKETTTEKKPDGEKVKTETKEHTNGSTTQETKSNATSNPAPVAPTTGPSKP